MLADGELKRLLQTDLSRSDKVLLAVASFEKPIGLSEVRARAKALGCNMDSWNLSVILSRNKGQTLNVPGGHEIGDKGRARLQEIGVGKLTPAASQVATNLRAHLSKIGDPDTQAFVEEAIRCYEFGLYRSAIVMSWLAAVDVLHNQVVAHHLSAFNAEAKRVDSRWKPAITADDVGRMKESDFLDRLVAISMIGKNVKDELVKALGLRNGSGHPNSLKVSSNQTAAHVELLLLNVFEKFAG